MNCWALYVVHIYLVFLRHFIFSMTTFILYVTRLIWNIQVAELDEELQLSGPIIVKFYYIYFLIELPTNGIRYPSYFKIYLGFSSVYFLLLFTTYARMLGHVPLTIAINDCTERARRLHKHGCHFVQIIRYMLCYM